MAHNLSSQSFCDISESEVQVNLVINIIINVSYF